MANMLIITGAGFTTTSAPVSWLIYCLVDYEGTRDRLYEELCESGIANGKELVTWTCCIGPCMSWVKVFVYIGSQDPKKIPGDCSGFPNNTNDPGR